MAGENKLSDKALKSLEGKPQQLQKIVADGRGLSVRVSTNGAVSFVFFFTHSGRQSAPVWIMLGRYPDMALNQAREKGRSAGYGYPKDLIHGLRTNSSKRACSHLSP